MASSKLPEQFQKHVKYLRDNLKEQIAQYDKAAHMLKLLTYLKEYPRFAPLKPYIHDWLDGGRPKLEVDVKSFPDVLPILEQLAAWGADFTRTYDAPNWSERVYYSDTVVVSAHLKEGSADCRRVIVGWNEPAKPTPIYKFECGPETDLPPVNPDPQLPAELQ